MFLQGNKDANPDYGYTNFDTWYLGLIALLAAVNIVFLAMDEYKIECDNNDREDGGYLDGM